MPSVSRTALINYSAQQMFELVNTIEAYPEYMPGCLGAEIINRTETVVEARLTLGKSGISQSFVTRNTLVPFESMTMALVEGPFKQFDGQWRFEALSEGACKVSLDLNFEFNNPLLAMAMNQKLQDSAGKQVDAVCQRADFLYKNTP